jgi:hypothetical protein
MKRIEINAKLKEIEADHFRPTQSLGDAHYKGDKSATADLFQMAMKSHEDMRALLGMAEFLKMKLDIAIAGVKDMTRGCYECDAGMQAEELIRRLKDV